MELSSSRHTDRKDQSHRDFQAIAATVEGGDTSHSCVGYRGQDLIAQDRILAHLSRHKRKDVTLITFQEVGDPIDRVSSNNKAIFSYRKNFRHHDGRYMLRSL